MTYRKKVRAKFDEGHSNYHNATFLDTLSSIQPTETILKPIKLGKGLNFHCMLYGSDIVDINNGQTQESYNLSKNETERLYFGFGT